MSSTRGAIGRYLYWSDRAIQRVAGENDIELVGRRAWTIGLNWKVFTATVTSRERRTRSRFKVARQLGIDLGAALDHDLVTPHHMFVRGTAEVLLSTCQGWHSPQTFVMMHAELASTAGQRVGLCLFGSMGQPPRPTPGHGQLRGRVDLLRSACNR